MKEEKNKTLQEDRIITSEERLWLIQTVMNTKGLHGLLKEIENKFITTNISGLREPLKKAEAADTPQYENTKINVNNKTYDYVEDSGMYEKESIALVAAEFGSNISKEKQEPGTSSEIGDLPKQEELQPVNQSAQSEVEVNLNETNPDEVLAKPLTKVKELEKNNPWSDARTVSPGEIKL